MVFSSIMPALSLPVGVSVQSFINGVMFYRYISESLISLGNSTVPAAGLGYL